MNNISNPSHYRQGSIQPIDYIAANCLGFMEGNIIKYITRHNRDITMLFSDRFYQEDKQAVRDCIRNAIAEYRHIRTQ